MDGTVRKHQIAKRGQGRKVVAADSPGEDGRERKTRARRGENAVIFPPAEEEPPRISLDALSEVDIKIYEAMTPDVPMLPEEIARTGFPLQQVMTSMTMLEIAGAVEGGAGGYFLKHAADIIDNREKHLDE